MSDKIKPHHRARKAMLYVRQSSPNQVLRNQESTRLQYGMRKRLIDFGWQQIEVVDDDLGRSAAESGRRPGFQRLVADVCMGTVGAVAAREMSRFARNSKDWQQLIEVCRVVDTVLPGHVFVPFHYSEAPVNFLTIPHLDPIGKTPGLKITPVKIDPMVPSALSTSCPILRNPCGE